MVELRGGSSKIADCDLCNNDATRPLASSTTEGLVVAFGKNAATMNSVESPLANLCHSPKSSARKLSKLPS
jgi:hypothetical protein